MSASAQFDLSTAFLGQPKTLAYGLVRGAGNLVLQQQLSDNSIIAIYLLGEGPWDSLLRIWLDGVEGPPVFPGGIDFHNGFDGEIGFGMSPVSTGVDQHVDQYFSDVPAITATTFSRYAYLALRYPPNPLAPDANLTVLGDYQALRCRIFDASGNQTSFAWTQNPAWWICDFLIRKFILREAKANQPLVAAELARFDWAAWNAAAAYYDALITSGVPRFSDGGLVFLQSGMNATNTLEQMLLLCQSYLLERNGIFTLYPDQPRASVYLATTDSVVPGSFQPSKTTLRQGKNRITATWREENLASGSSDDGTRMAISTRQFDHVAHQLAIGARGLGLAVMPCVNEEQLDFGINTSERVARLCSFLLLRQFGDDVDPNFEYAAPFQLNVECYEDSLAVECGDVIEIDASVSEEFAGWAFEVLQIQENPDGTRKFTCLEYIPDAFGDDSQPRQVLQAPVPGTGLTFPFGLGPTGAIVVPLTKTVDAGNRYAPITGITMPTDLPYNAGFDIFPDTALIADGWLRDVDASWILGTYSRSAVPFNGSYAQSVLCAQGTASSLGSRPIGVKSGLEYSVRVRAKSSSALWGHVIGNIFWYTNDSNPSNAGGDFISASTFDANTSVGTSYFLLEGSVVAPANAQFARVVLYNFNDGTAGPITITFDTVQWTLSQVVPSASAVAVTSLPSTSSTSYTVLPDMSITVETQGQSVLLLFAGTVELISGSLTAFFAIFRDGVQITNDTQFPLNTFYGDQVAKISWIDVNPAPGSHTYEVNWKVSGNSMFCYDNRAFQALELN